MSKIVANGGLTRDLLEASVEGTVSPKIRGLKQGGIMLLSGLIVVPILGIISAILNVDPVAAGLAAIVLFWGGILRMVYALIFQSGKKTLSEKAGFVDSVRQNVFGPTDRENVLPPYQQSASTDFSEFQPAQVNWRETGDLESVTEDQNTTRSIRK